jgi:hypothetical protein
MERFDIQVGKIGEIYRDGSLPYGGRTNSRGAITYVVSKEEYDDKIDRLRSIE